MIPHDPPLPDLNPLEVKQIDRLMTDALAHLKNAIPSIIAQTGESLAQTEVTPSLIPVLTSLLESYLLNLHDCTAEANGFEPWHVEMTVGSNPTTIGAGLELSTRRPDPSDDSSSPVAARTPRVVRVLACELLQPATQLRSLADYRMMVDALAGAFDEVTAKQTSAYRGVCMTSRANMILGSINRTFEAIAAMKGFLGFELEVGSEPGLAQTDGVFLPNIEISAIIRPQGLKTCALHVELSPYTVVQLAMSLPDDSYRHPAYR